MELLPRAGGGTRVVVRIPFPTRREES